MAVTVTLAYGPSFKVYDVFLPTFHMISPDFQQELVYKGRPPQSCAPERLTSWFDAVTAWAFKTLIAKLLSDICPAKSSLWTGTHAPSNIIYFLWSEHANSGEVMLSLFLLPLRTCESEDIR